MDYLPWKSTAFRSYFGYDSGETEIVVLVSDWR
jgi:hypothetical protein